MRYLDRECNVCGLAHWRTRRWQPSECIAALKQELAEAQAQVRVERDRAGRIEYSARRTRDLERVVEDQRRHIANLEDDLLAAAATKMPSPAEQAELL